MLLVNFQVWGVRFFCLAGQCFGGIIFGGGDFYLSDCLLKLASSAKASTNNRFLNSYGLTLRLKMWAANKTGFFMGNTHLEYTGVSLVL